MFPLENEYTSLLPRNEHGITKRPALKWKMVENLKTTTSTTTTYISIAGSRFVKIALLTEVLDF